LTKQGGHKGLKLIGGFKLVKGLLLIAIAFGALKFLNGNVQETIRHLVQHFNADPGGKYFQKFATKVLRMSPKLPMILIATASYGALFCVEGVGLLLEARWAEYLTIIATGSFLPLEIYEIVKHVTPTKIAALVLNLVIFVYLIIRLKRDKPNKVRE
jgi:uncharacterized membrane protein (DUF2068 family)